MAFVVDVNAGADCAQASARGLNVARSAMSGAVENGVMFVGGMSVVMI